MVSPFGQARHCAVTGFPVSHSLSVTIHRAAYRLLDLDWTYDYLEVPPADFLPVIRNLDSDYRGLSVTMPHKSVAATLGQPSDNVRLTRVANTVILDPDQWRVHNTDIDGFVDALTDGGEFGNASIIGTGATSRSAVVACFRMGVRYVEILGRDPHKAAAVAALAADLGMSAKLGTWGDALNPNAQLVISTIPRSGLDTIVPALAAADSAPRCYFDVIYHPWPSPLARLARERDAELRTGLDLLVNQARHQVRLMTGLDVPVAPLMLAAQTELHRREQA